MLKNEPTLAIVAVHTADNEPLKILGVIQFNLQCGPSTEPIPGPCVESAGND